MDKKYYDSGGLFAPRVKVENSPDFRGDVELSKELCAYIKRKSELGEDVKINIAIWSKQGKSGEYLSANIKQAWEKTNERKFTSDDSIPF